PRDFFFGGSITGGRMESFGEVGELGESDEIGGIRDSEGIGEVGVSDTAGVTVTPGGFCLSDLSDTLTF
ncbi:MAG: hypothetical protein AAB599_01650, partial [Patescibacteria group bacterium]